MENRVNVEFKGRIDVNEFDRFLEVLKVNKETNLSFGNTQWGIKHVDSVYRYYENLINPDNEYLDNRESFIMSDSLIDELVSDLQILHENFNSLELILHVGDDYESCKCVKTITCGSNGVSVLSPVNYHIYDSNLNVSNVDKETLYKTMLLTGFEFKWEVGVIDDDEPTQRSINNKYFEKYIKEESDKYRLFKTIKSAFDEDYEDFNVDEYNFEIRVGVSYELDGVTVEFVDLDDELWDSYYKTFKGLDNVHDILSKINIYTTDVF